MKLKKQLLIILMLFLTITLLNGADTPLPTIEDVGFYKANIINIFKIESWLFDIYFIFITIISSFLYSNLFSIIIASLVLVTIIEIFYSFIHGKLENMLKVIYNSPKDNIIVRMILISFFSWTLLYPVELVKANLKIEKTEDDYKVRVFKSYSQPDIKKVLEDLNIRASAIKHIKLKNKNGIAPLITVIPIMIYQSVVYGVPQNVELYVDKGIDAKTFSLINSDVLGDIMVNVITNTEALVKDMTSVLEQPAKLADLLTTLDGFPNAVINYNYNYKKILEKMKKENENINLKYNQLFSNHMEKYFKLFANNNEKISKYKDKKVLQFLLNHLALSFNLTVSEAPLFKLTNAQIEGMLQNTRKIDGDTRKAIKVEDEPATFSKLFGDIIKEDENNKISLSTIFNSYLDTNPQNSNYISQLPELNIAKVLEYQKKDSSLGLKQFTNDEFLTKLAKKTKFGILNNIIYNETIKQQLLLNTSLYYKNRANVENDFNFYPIKILKNSMLNKLIANRSNRKYVEDYEVQTNKYRSDNKDLEIIKQYIKNQFEKEIIELRLKTYEEDIEKIIQSNYDNTFKEDVEKKENNRFASKIPLYLDKDANMWKQLADKESFNNEIYKNFLLKMLKNGTIFSINNSKITNNIKEYLEIIKKHTEKTYIPESLVYKDISSFNLNDEGKEWEKIKSNNHFNKQIYEAYSKDNEIFLNVIDKLIKNYIPETLYNKINLKETAKEIYKTQKEIFIEKVEEEKVLIKVLEGANFVDKEITKSMLETDEDFFYLTESANLITNKKITELSTWEQNNLKKILIKPLKLDTLYDITDTNTIYSDITIPSNQTIELLQKNLIKKDGSELYEVYWTNFILNLPYINELHKNNLELFKNIEKYSEENFKLINKVISNQIYREPLISMLKDKEGEIVLEDIKIEDLLEVLKENLNKGLAYKPNVYHWLDQILSIVTRTFEEMIILNKENKAYEIKEQKPLELQSQLNLLKKEPTCYEKNFKEIELKTNIAGMPTNLMEVINNTIDSWKVGLKCELKPYTNKIDAFISFFENFGFYFSEFIYNVIYLFSYLMFLTFLVVVSIFYSFYVGTELFKYSITIIYESIKILSKAEPDYMMFADTLKNKIIKLFKTISGPLVITIMTFVLKILALLMGTLFIEMILLNYFSLFALYLGYTIISFFILLAIQKQFISVFTESVGMSSSISGQLLKMTDSFTRHSISYTAKGAIAAPGMALDVTKKAVEKPIKIAKKTYNTGKKIYQTGKKAKSWTSDKISNTNDKIKTISKPLTNYASDIYSKNKEYLKEKEIGSSIKKGTKKISSKINDTTNNLSIKTMGLARNIASNFLTKKKISDNGSVDIQSNNPNIIYSGYNGKIDKKPKFKNPINTMLTYAKVKTDKLKDATKNGLNNSVKTVKAKTAKIKDTTKNSLNTSIRILNDKFGGIKQSIYNIGSYNTENNNVEKGKYNKNIDKKPKFKNPINTMLTYAKEQTKILTKYAKLSLNTSINSIKLIGDKLGKTIKNKQEKENSKQSNNKQQLPIYNITNNYITNKLSEIGKKYTFSKTIKDIFNNKGEEDKK